MATIRLSRCIIRIDAAATHAAEHGLKRMNFNMSKLDVPRLYCLIVTMANGSTEYIKAFRAPDVGTAYELARQAGYTPIAIHGVY